MTLQAPQEHAHRGPIEVTAILAREENPAPGQALIKWMLLTNLPVEGGTVDTNPHHPSLS